MILLALVPPLWFRYMNARIDDARAERAHRAHGLAT